MELIKNRDPKIYIICGTAQQGKDTLGTDIKEYYETNLKKKAIELSYAYYIKDYAKQLSSWDGREETKPRTLLQTLGTDVIRKYIDPNFFAHRMVEDIQVFSFYKDILIIPDGRFQDEIEYVKKRFPNVVTIHIIRPNYDAGLSKVEQSHSTETGLKNMSDYHYEVINDGSIEELKEKAKAIVREVEHEN